MQIKCTFPNISYLSEKQKNNIQILTHGINVHNVCVICLSNYAKRHICQMFVNCLGTDDTNNGTSTVRVIKIYWVRNFHLHT